MCVKKKMLSTDVTIIHIMSLKLLSKYATVHNTDVPHNKVTHHQQNLLKSLYNEEEILRYAIQNKWSIILVTSRGEKGKYWYLKGKGNDRGYLQTLIEESEKRGDNPDSRLYFIDNFLMSLL